MSFLDQPTVSFTKREVRELWDLLVLAYDDPTVARQKAYAADMVPGTWPSHPQLRTTWHDAIQVLALQGKLRGLVERAAKDPEVAAFLDRFRDFLSDSPAVSAEASTGLAKNAKAWKGGEISLERLVYRRARWFPVYTSRCLAEASHSVCKIDARFETAAVYGTGFLIAPELVLTSHHNVCSRQLGALRSLAVDFDYEERGSEEPLILRGLTGSVDGEPDPDWAVFRLPRKVDRRPLRLGSSLEPAVSDLLFVIQHPGGGLKAVSLDFRAIRYVDEQVVQFIADTMKGSSGSPLINDRCEVIAMHRGGVEEPDTIEIGGMEIRVWKNEGIRIERVLERLEAHGVSFERNDGRG